MKAVRFHLLLLQWMHNTQKCIKKIQKCQLPMVSSVKYCYCRNAVHVLVSFLSQELILSERKSCFHLSVTSRAIQGYVFLCEEHKSCPLFCFHGPHEKGSMRFGIHSNSCRRKPALISNRSECIK